MYDDGEVGFEDLQHKKHKLPDLHGDEVLNPDADALSSSDSEDVLQPAGQVLTCSESLHTQCPVVSQARGRGRGGGGLAA